MYLHRQHHAGWPTGSRRIELADITAYTADYDPSLGGGNFLSTITISTTTQADGTYQLIVPRGGTDYYIDAYSSSSSLAETTDITNPSTTVPNVVDLTLADASTPTFADLTLDIITATLPVPTTQAADQALMTRIAVANKRHASPAMLNRLQQLRTNKDS